jgi:hypothetical protein
MQATLNIILTLQSLVVMQHLETWAKHISEGNSMNINIRNAIKIIIRQNGVKVMKV